MAAEEGRVDRVDTLLHAQAASPDILNWSVLAGPAPPTRWREGGNTEERGEWTQ